MLASLPQRRVLRWWHTGSAACLNPHRGRPPPPAMSLSPADPTAQLGSRFPLSCHGGDGDHVLGAHLPHMKWGSPCRQTCSLCSRLTWAPPTPTLGISPPLCLSLAFLLLPPLEGLGAK